MITFLIGIAILILVGCSCNHRDYIANELLAPQAAYNTLSEMKRKIASLESMPERNPLVDVKKWIEQGV